MAKIERLSASPGAIKATDAAERKDRRSADPSYHSDSDPRDASDGGPSGARSRPAARSRSQIPDAKFVEYPGEDHVFWSGDVEEFLGDIEEFVTGSRDRSSIEIERILATVLFTDIVDSTRSAAAMGDQAWRRLLDNHDADRAANGREVPGQSRQDDRRRNPRDLRWSRPRGPLRAGVQRRCRTNRAAAPGRPSHRRDRTAGSRRRRHRHPRRRPRHGAGARPAKSWFRGS